MRKSRMSSVARVALVVWLFAAVALPSAQPTSVPGAPKLVLLVAVDQFRYDYLTRFRDEYTAGLKQLLNDGAVFTDANLEHYPTVTAVGHATMLTGALPSVSGIIGNDWFDREGGASVTSVSDPAVELLGVPPGRAGASPHRLLVTTVADELKAARRAPAGAAAPRVIGLSLKDRSAILAVGRGADAAYWFDTTTGHFVSSTYYFPQPPEWLAAFNARKLADGHAGKAWTFLDPSSGPGHTLPAQPGQPLYNAVYGSPFGNDLLLALAEQVLDAERLGRRGTTDVLSVSFSSNDSVGHTYGPDSPEVRDISIRTDRVVGRLLDRVDQLVGLRNTIVVLTSDHGVAPLPEVQAERRQPGGRVDGKAVFGPIERALETRFGPGRWVLATAGSSPYFDHALIAEKGLPLSEVRQVAADAAATAPAVVRVFTYDQLRRGEAGTDRMGQRVLRSFNARRSGDLEILLEPHWMRSSVGTTHGTPYGYDAHIPLILMGPGVKGGRYTAHAALNDLAPTLATLLDVEIPSGSSGRVLGEALQGVAAGAPAMTH